MQITDKIKGQFGSWWPLFLPLIESQEWDNIFSFLKAQSLAKRIIIPKSSDLFKSFELCDKDKVKAVIILMDPYPSFKDDVMISNGVPMSCANIKSLQPSLDLFYDGIENSFLGFDPDMDKRLDNSYLLTSEHVLLINSSFSVEKDKVGSHAHIWAPFMKFFIEEILNKYYRGLPVILAGTAAQKFEKYINPMIHHIKKIEHPVAAAYSNRSWNYDDVFKWINNILRANNGPAAEIRWYRKKGEDNYKDLPDWVTDGETKKFSTTKNLPKAQDLGLPWKDE